MRLKNPDNGAPIRDFWFENVFYFDSKIGKEFKPGETVDLPDAFGKYLKGVYGFLEEVSELVVGEEEIKAEPPKEEVKEAVEEKAPEEKIEKPVQEYKCDHPGCQFVSKYRLAVSGHKNKHKAEFKKQWDATSVSDSEIANMEVDNAREGLVGEGLVEESSPLRPLI